MTCQWNYILIFKQGFPPYLYLGFIILSSYLYLWLRFFPSFFSLETPFALILRVNYMSRNLKARHRDHTSQMDYSVTKKKPNKPKNTTNKQTNKSHTHPPHSKQNKTKQTTNKTKPKPTGQDVSIASINIQVSLIHFVTGSAQLFIVRGRENTLMWDRVKFLSDTSFL